MKKQAVFTLAIVVAACLSAHTVATVAMVLEITPVEDFEPSGLPGGPFTPIAKDYQLTNTGPNSLYWGADKSADWLDLYPDWGPLEPNESTIVTVSLTADVNLLPEGDYNDTLTFLDITNDELQTRDVNLTIAFPGGIWVSPNSFDVNIVEGCTQTETLTIGNDGDFDLTFTVRARAATSSEQSQQAGGGQTPAGKSGILSTPKAKGRDFTVAADVPYKPGELLVRFAPGSNGKPRTHRQKIQILNSLGGATRKRDFKIVPGLSAVKLPPGMTVEQALQRFNKASGILYAQPNYQLKALSTFPNDPRFSELWGMHNTGQTGGTPDADIDAPEAWDMATGSKDVIVAVIDSGVDYTHPDLAANMWVNQQELEGVPGVDDDNNFCVDDIYGYDFINGDGDPMDDRGHGTHCAGILGAVGDNSEGVPGVCWDVKIMALKFLGADGNGWSDDAIACLDYAVLMKANLSSNSYGGGPYEQPFRDAIDAAGAAGMLFVAAAGNDYGFNNDIIPHYPSSYDCESIIAVLSTDKDDSLSSFSNFGPTSVDLGAPGSSILSCKLGGGYKYNSGTSMATPHVAGACALLWSINPALTSSEVKDILLQTVDPTLSGLCVSEGRLNLYNAVSQTSAASLIIEPEGGTIPPGDSNDISVTFNAIGIMPGTYQAEIVIDSNDPYRLTTVVPVTMTVSPDALVVTPDENFDSNGTEGGPFTPQCMTYTLTNDGIEPLSWTTDETEDWLVTDPCQGLLNPAQSVDVNVCIAPTADLLEPNIYTEILTFRNLDSNSIKTRSFTLTVKLPDHFTQPFDTNETDLELLSLTFSPDGSTAYYQACRQRVRGLPTDPNDCTNVSLGDDDFAEIILSDGKEILFYGVRYDRFYIGSNGYITFGQGDTEYVSSLENHFSMPRISAAFDDLDPANGEDNISYSQFDDSVVVTFQNVPLFPNKTGNNTFQVEMFFVDGTIRITWLDVEAAAPIVGLSQGSGVSDFFTASDLSEYPPCWPPGDFDRNYFVDFRDFAILAAYWRDSDCCVPSWCGKTDIDFSGATDTNDLDIFVGNWLTTEDWWLQPISHWKFDEGEGDTAYDSISINHGIIYDANWTDGVIDGALVFDGDGDYIDLGNHDSLKPPLPLTISAWVRLSSLANTQYIIALDDQTFNYYGIWFYVGTENNLGVNFGDGGGKSSTNRKTKVGTTALNADTWYHVAAVISNTVDISLYVDGADDSGTYSGTAENLEYSNGTSLIGIKHGGQYSFDGKIDDVRLYDRILSAGEIEQLYRDGLGGKAFNPRPADGAVDVDPNTILSWSPGVGILSHNIYLGTDYNDVNDANTTDPNVYVGNQDANSYDPNGLAFATTYYWRIDEVGPLDTYKGDVWSFTVWSEFDPNLDLIGWWKFDEGTGDTAFDSAGDNHGTVYDTNWTTGIIGGALNFDGDADYVDLGNDGSLKPLLPATFSAWVRLSSQGNAPYIIAVDNQTSRYYGIWFSVNSSDKLAVSYGDGGGPDPTNRRSKAGTTTLSADTWYHVAAVITGGTDMSLYVDGIDDEGAYSGTGGSLSYSTDSVLIGTRHDFEFSFDGKIDDVRIYERALTDQDMWSLYQDGLN